MVSFTYLLELFCYTSLHLQFSSLEELFQAWICLAPVYLESLVWSQSNFPPFGTKSELHVQTPSGVPHLQCGHKVHLSGRKHVFHEVLQKFPLHRCTGLLAMTQQYATAVQKSTSHFSAIGAWCKTWDWKLTRTSLLVNMWCGHMVPEP